ncbi:MAG: TolC family protein [Planctomycetes bacterium]|nr:TolC family protein [Planctomycetota bacterium]
MALRAICFLFGGVVAAQAPVPEPQAPVPVDVDADRLGAPVRLLSLAEVLQLGRLHNVSLRAAELLPQQARLDLVFAEAGFEPELYGSVGYADAESPQRNLFQPSVSQQTIDATVGWRQRVVTGGLFDLAFQPARYETSGSAAFPTKQYAAAWTVSFRQPLLRGAWTDYNLAPIAAARYRERQAGHEFDRAVQDTLLAIVQAYWELVFARENWRVVGSALAVAQEQLRITEERIRVRELAPRDRVADESEVARRREELIVAENAIRAREDALRELLFDGADAQLWRYNLRPTEPLDVQPSLEPVAFEPLVDVALLQRPELRSQRSAVAAAEVALTEAERDTLPGLDLIGGWSSDGVRDDGFADAFADAVDQQYPDWSVRLEFSLPIGNHAARSQRQRAALEVERQRRELHAATLRVTNEVRDAARNLQSFAQSIAASGESVRLATTNLETEQVKLRVGASTAFEVQRRIQELREARSRHLRNQLDYRIAESRLLHAQGLLEVPAPR